MTLQMLLRRCRWLLDTVERVSKTQVTSSHSSIFSVGVNRWLYISVRLMREEWLMTRLSGGAGALSE